MSERNKILSSFRRMVIRCLLAIVASVISAPIYAGTSPTLVAQPGVAAPASIAELARALKNDALLIYEYVYANIEYSPTYGQKKGAFGTLLDGHGNDFDQAALMVALLRQSGYSVSYKYGTIRLSPSVLSNWLAVDTSNGCAVADLLTRAGIPYTLNPTSCSSGLTYVDMDHVWVSATGGSLGSTTYVFDPSFKTRTTRTSGIDIPSAMQYCRTGLPPAKCLLDQALSGASIGTSPPSIQYLNTTNLRNRLNDYTSNLINYIRTNMPTATTADVVGGSYIQPLTQPFTPQTSLSYEKPGDSPATWPGEIPNSYRTTLGVQLGAINLTYYGDEIYGHRLSIVYNSSNRPVLYLDGVVQATDTASSTAINYTVTFPFCFSTSGMGSVFCGGTGSGRTNVFTAQNNIRAQVGYTYAIVNGWDFTARGMVDFHRDQLQANQAGGATPSSEAVLGESLNMIGYSWLSQWSAVSDLQDRVLGTQTVLNCSIGVVGWAGGPYIDMPGLFVGFSSRSNTTAGLDPHSVTAFFGIAGHGSAFEWGVLDQNLSQQGVGAVSTVKLLDIANNESDIIYDANSSNWSTIKSAVQAHYNTPDLNTIESYINSGYRVILPSNGQVTQGAWTGVGYIALLSNNIGYLITSNIKGGYSDQSVPQQDVVSATINTTPSIPPAPQKQSLEPIDLGSGAYLYDNNDIVIGSAAFPVGLDFHRSYSSSNRKRVGPLGFGWTHDYAITASPNSDGLKGLAQDSPIQGAAAIVEIYASLDLLSDSGKPLTNVLVANMAQRWFMDQLINNIVNVSVGSQTEQFVLLPDKSYQAQLGLSDRLSMAGGTYLLQRKNGQQLTFDTAGNISRWADPAGPTVSFSYNASTPPRLTAVTNNAGRSLALIYSATNQLTSVRDSAGRTVSYSYDALGNLASYSDPSGNVTRYAYQSSGNVTSSGLLTQIYIPSLNGRTFVTNIYDSLGRVGSQANTHGALWTYFFAGYRSEEVDAAGTRHVLYYNPRGKATFEIQDLANLDLVTSTSYDGLDRMIGTTLPRGNGVAYQYDDVTNAYANNVLSITRIGIAGSPSSTTQTFTYNQTWNKVATQTDALGLVSTFQYDDSGNLAEIVADAGAVPHLNSKSTFRYNALGVPIVATDPTGAATQLTYDSLGNLVSWTADYGPGRLNLATTFSFDPVGNRIATTDPKGNRSTFSYDASRRLIASTAPAPFNAGASPVQTLRSYDADGRLLTVTRANGAAAQVTSTTYTLTGKVETVTDPNGNTTTNTYDALDRLQTINTPFSANTRRLTRLAYDAVNRLSQVTDPSGVVSQQLAYNANGKLASFLDARGNSTTYNYDGFERLLNVTYPIDSTGGHPVESRLYDADDNITQQTTRAGQQITFAYDTLNRLCTKTIAATPISCAATSSASPTAWTSYDLAGRVRAIADNSATIVAAAPGSPVTFVMSYNYDQLNRLTKTNWSPTPTPTPAAVGSVTFNHAYNGANQRISQTVTDPSWWYYPTATSSTTNYTVNPANQYTAVASVTPTYDVNGNLTGDGTFSFGYDAENRMTSASGAGNTSSYGHDSQGHRKSKAVNGTATITVNDADNRAVLDYDGSSGVLLRWYAYGLGPNDVLSQMTIGGTRLTLTPDSLNSIIASVDSSSGAFTKLNYLPFGKSASASIVGTFGYTGQRIDPENGGLYYYRSRIYYPAWGRFSQLDPIGLRGGINLYGYVENDPLNVVDPLGLSGNGLLQSVGGQVRSFVDSGIAAMATIPTDIGRMTRDLATNPVQFWQSSQPALAGLGMTFPVVSAGTAAAPEIAASSRVVNIGDYTLTGTVANNLSRRPYINNLTIQEITATGRSVPDPGGIPGALRYDVPGTMSRANVEVGAPNATITGNYELVIHPETNVIYHMLFQSEP